MALACAIVGRPGLVFLDEPTAGLDAHARILVWELISRLRDDGVSVLLTTHLMDEAEELADQIVIIDAGQVVASGTPAELTRRGADGELRFTTAAEVDVEALSGALPAHYGVSVSSSGAYVVVGEVTPELIASITAWCAEHGVLISDLRVDTRSLEDVFLSLTGREVRS